MDKAIVISVCRGINTHGDVALVIYFCINTHGDVALVIYFCQVLIYFQTYFRRVDLEANSALMPRTLLEFTIKIFLTKQRYL